MIEDRDFVRPSRIAFELDIADGVVKRWIRSGELRTVTIDGQTRVPVESYQGFLRRKIAVTDPTVV
jgi:predicted site-specific integrase-resolvase